MRPAGARDPAGRIRRGGPGRARTDDPVPSSSTAVPAYQCTITTTGEPLDDQDFNPHFPPNSGKCACTHS
jgi:hypothetical protein